MVPALPITGSPTLVRGLDGWPEDAYERHVKYEVTLMESALELCRQGRVAGYFPRFIVEENVGPVPIRVDDADRHCNCNQPQHVNTILR